MGVILSTMKRDDLTSQQSKVLAFVKKHLKDKGYPPTRKEIMQAFDWKSNNAAQEHLSLIEKKGYIRLDAGVQRGIVIL